MLEQILVTNQVLVTSQVSDLQRDSVQRLDLGQEAFRYEPTVFVPRLTAVVKNIDIKSILAPANLASKTLTTAIPVLCVHTDEGQENNTEELAEELRARQMEYSLGQREGIEMEEDKEQDIQLETKNEDWDPSENIVVEQRHRARGGWFEETDIPQMTVEPRRHNVSYRDVEEKREGDEEGDEEGEEELGFMGTGRLPEGRTKKRFSEDEVSGPLLTFSTTLFLGVHLGGMVRQEPVPQAVREE